MTHTENNLNHWRQANRLPKAAKESLQVMRSLECQPEFLGANLWKTSSTTKPGVVYRQEVFFTGMNEAVMLGIGLYVECNCPSRRLCKHVLKVEAKMHANWKYYFQLFGLETSERMSELHSRARAIAARMTIKTYKKAA